MNGSRSPRPIPRVGRWKDADPDLPILPEARKEHAAQASRGPRAAETDLLRESDTIFKTVFMMVADAFYVTTLEEGVILEINRAFEELFGYSRQDAIGRTSKDLDIWVDYADRIAMRDGLRQNGFVRRIETHLRKKNGECFDCSTSASVVTVSGIACMVGVIRDITERKRAEQMLLESRQALADSEESLLALMDSTNDLIWAVDPVRFGLVRFNRGLHQYFAREGIACCLGMDPAELKLPPFYVTKWHERYTRALREGPFVEEYIPFPGRPVLLLSLNLVKRGDEVVAISVFAKDITERKEAENALREGQERFRQVAESVSDFIWEVDADGTYSYTSPAVETILGYRPDELVGRVHFYDLFHPEVREETKAAAFAAFAARQPVRAFPNQNVSKDGRMVWLETSGVPILDDAGHLLGYRGANSDVTERWHAERSLRDLSGRLITAQEAERSRLARDLHDDICQRLAVLSIQLALLVQAPARSATSLRAEVAGLRNQVEAMSDELRRISHDLHPAMLEQLGLASALRGLCADLNKAARVVIRCESRSVPRDLPMAIALCLYRVAQESLQNVIKHSRAARACVDLTTTADSVVLVVTDDGHGFDIAAAQHGAALGLANMRERVRLVAGSLAIDCPAGGGTRVEVRVPLYPNAT